MNEEARKKLTIARSQLILKRPFWGYLALHLEPVEDNNMPYHTLGTDGEKLLYDSDHIMSITEQELQTKIAHEVFHCAFGHIWRRGTRRCDVWNSAADYAANNILVAEKFFASEGMLLNRAFEGMSAEQVYDKLLEEQEKSKRQEEGDGEGNGEGEGSSSGDQGKQPDKQPDTSEQPGTKDDTKPDAKDDMRGEHPMDDHSPWDKHNGNDKPGSALGEALGIAGDGKDLEQEWKEQVARARQMAKAQGVGMGSLDQLIDEVLEPQISWKEILRSMIASCMPFDYRMMPPNKKHLWRGIYLPSIYGERVELAIAIDTSGSMSDLEIAQGLAEIISLCSQYQDYTIHYYQCDSGIQYYQELGPYDELPRKISGRGGTSFVPVFNDIKDKGLDISVLVYFTDLYGTFPDEAPPFPTVWITEDKSMSKKVPFGEVVVCNPSEK